MRLHNNEEIVDYVNLFVSVLICFPEVGKIRFDRDSDILTFSFMLKDVSSIPDFDGSLKKIRTAVEKYHRLDRTREYHFSVEQYRVGDYIVIEARRDMLSASRAEITFLIELFRLEFIHNIMVEKMDTAFEDDYQWYYEEGAQHRINDKRISMDEKTIGNQIVVCREAGKVLVFSN
ncbi:MAG: hypothetical protein IJF43_02245 [Firmicutes bacterium]|nr:hypothetical protein [Bacillota bacterium]MBQ4092737.1 hypothetical protein [Bacillota bacterium]